MNAPICGRASRRTAAASLPCWAGRLAGGDSGCLSSVFLPNGVGRLPGAPPGSTAKAEPWAIAGSSSFGQRLCHNYLPQQYTQIAAEHLPAPRAKEAELLGWSWAMLPGADQQQSKLGTRSGNDGRSIACFACA